MTAKRNTPNKAKKKDSRLKELRESIEEFAEEHPDMADRFKRFFERLESVVTEMVRRKATDEEIDLAKFDLMVEYVAPELNLGKDLRPALSDALRRFSAAALCVYAQVYYKMIEAVSTCPVAYADFTLNQYYLLIVKKIKYLLSMKELKDFTGEFNPPEHILPSSGLGDIGWEDVVAPPTESFMASVQTFLNELDLTDEQVAERAFFLKWLHKTVEPIFKKIEEYRQRTEKHFEGLVRNLKREQKEIEEAAKHEKQKEPCTKEEYDQLTSIHRRLKDLMKLLRSSDRDVEDIEYKQIELDEDVTEFWPTIEKIGWGVGIDVSGKLDVLKDIILDKEIQSSLSGAADLFSCGCWIDGKSVDEIEFAEMVREEEEKAAKPRYDLLRDLDRIMVRLAKCFGVNREIPQEETASAKPIREPARTEQENESQIEAGQREELHQQRTQHTSSSPEHTGAEKDTTQKAGPTRGSCGSNSMGHDRPGFDQDSPSVDDISNIPPEERRNSDLYLLMLLAQAYYKMLECTVSMASWCTMLDLELNGYYLWTVECITNLLNKSENLKDFPEPFEPPFPDLYPTTISDYDWQDQVAPGVEQFLSTVQRYVQSKGIYEPEKDSVGWIFIELFRPSLNAAVEKAVAYNKRMRQYMRKALDSVSPKADGATPAKGSEQSASDTGKVENAAQSEQSGKPIKEPPKTEQDADKARHSIDFRSIHWFGNDYSFTANQAAAVKILWDAWENKTPDVGGDTMAVAADSESRRARDIFKGNPALGSMIRQGKTKGTYRLVERHES